MEKKESFPISAKSVFRFVATARGMAARHNSSREAEEFARDLGSIQTRIEDEAHLYPDMSPEGKRKCMDDLENTIKTLQKIKGNLKEADDHSPDKNLVQVLWKGPLSFTFTRQDVIQSFAAIRLPVQVVSVEYQDNFTLTPNKFLEPIRMCFIKFVTEEEASMVLGLKQMVLSVQRHVGYSIEFIPPTQSSATYKTFRIIGNSIARLGEIIKEYKKIGAVRVNYGKPELGKELIDKSWYLAQLPEFKRLRAAGVSLDLQGYGPLAGRKPVDSEALKAIIKQLYDEEYDILIMLREYQLNGVDFEFKHTAKF